PSDGARSRLPGATGDDDPTDAGSTLWAPAGPARVTASARPEAPSTPARTDRSRSRALVLRRVSARPVTGVLPPCVARQQALNFGTTMDCRFRETIRYVSRDTCAPPREKCDRPAPSRRSGPGAVVGGA